MKVVRTNMQNLAMLSAVIAFASCESNKKAEINQNGTEVVTPRTPEADTLDKAANPPLESQSVGGKVAEVNFGKDGYTAKLETASGEAYFATVSRSNLKDPSEYRELKVGDEIHVIGDHWKNAEGKDELTVRELH